MALHDIFLSHSEQDEVLINNIAKALKSLDLDVYVEEYETNYGTKVIESVVEAIDLSDNFLVVLTEKSVRSQWVNQEIGYAFAKEKHFIPVRVGDKRITGMIGDIKGLKSSTNNEEEIISKIINYYMNELGLDVFWLECEKCGDKGRWDIPSRSDKYNWRKKKKKPTVFECWQCGHKNKINPLTLLIVE